MREFRKHHKEGHLFALAYTHHNFDLFSHRFSADGRFSWPFTFDLVLFYVLKTVRLPINKRWKILYIQF